MLTLAIDCTTQTLSLALLDGSEVRAETNLNPGRHHAETLLPAAERLLAEAVVEPGNVDLLACTVGPGSFTGLRIGVSTLKGMALALGKPVVGVSTLEALAQNAMPAGRLVCPMLDARRDQVYAGLYRTGPEGCPEPAGKEALVGIDSLLERLGDGEVLFLGDGAVRHEERLVRVMGPRAILAQSGCHAVRAGAVGMIALRRFREKGGGDDAVTLAPRYLRLSEAEMKIAGTAPVR